MDIHAGVLHCTDPQSGSDQLHHFGEPVGCVAPCSPTWKSPGGAKLTRWDPSSGSLLEVIPIPALNVTACAFGRPNLTELYITSARKGMGAEQLAHYPLSGSFFRLQTNIHGLPTFGFGG